LPANRPWDVLERLAQRSLSGRQWLRLSMRVVRSVVVLDAADLAAESAFWAGMLDGQVLEDEKWHSVIDADGQWRLGVQLAPDHIAPDWPDGVQQQQIHLDLHVVDPREAHDTAVALGARLLQAASDFDSDEGFQVYADPAGHPFCLGWGHPTESRLAELLAEARGRRKGDA
jgi:hypothetical protein